jgi:adenylate cyclase
MDWLRQTAGMWGRGLAVGLFVVLVSHLGLLEAAEQWSFNALFQLRGPQPPQAPVVIISIDEDSFDELNLAWPFPRALHGQLLDLLSRARPAAIGFDIVFAEPSARGDDDDAKLAAAIGRAGNVILGAAITDVQGTPVQGVAQTKTDLNPPLKILRKQAAGYGFVNPMPDDDAFIRSIQLTRTFDNDALANKELLSFDLSLYRLAVKAGVQAGPADRTWFLINYRGGPKTFETVPYYRVLYGEVPPETFAGKIVLVGATSPILHDVFPTPFAPQGDMPGVEIHANVLETLIRGIPISRAPWAAIAALIVAGGLLTVWVTNRLRPVQALAVMLALAGGYAAAAFGFFVKGRMWVDVVSVPGALGLAYGATVLENFVREQREKRRLARFFSPKVLEEIVRHRTDQALGTARKRITVLFSDIRGFTTLSEKLQPEQVVEILKEYLTELTEVVFQHGGTVDKYVGDCIMALYNVPFEDPEHAVKAVQTAVDFQRHTKMVSDRWHARLGIEIKNGVGINTGEAVVGTMGSEQRLEYTAIGDTVNLAARLESITKEFRSPIIISESTYQDVRGRFRTRYLGEVTVKGKEIPIKIYGVTETVEENVRQDPRVEVATSVTISDGEVVVPAQVTDVSMSGLAVHQLSRKFEVGQVVRIRLTVPGLVDPVSLNGKVIWSTEDKTGLRFFDLEPSTQEALRSIVARQGIALR